MCVPILSAQLVAFFTPAAPARHPGADWDPTAPGFAGPRRGVSDFRSPTGEAGAPAVPLLRSLWSGGQALLSIFSLVVVTPVVAIYLLYDWNRMVATVDGWVPVRQREAVRALARQIDDASAGFVRGQTAVCLILGSFYALGLSLVGLNFGLLIGLASGLLTFIPYVGSLTGLVLAGGVAIAQFWPEYTTILIVLAVFFAAVPRRLCPRADARGREKGCIRWDDVRAVRVRISVRFVGCCRVPLAAAIGVLARFALQQYLASPFHTGEPTAGPVGFLPRAAPRDPE